MSVGGFRPKNDVTTTFYVSVFSLGGERLTNDTRSVTRIVNRKKGR